MNNLSSIFTAIIPENLKNTPAINDSIEIFIELLEEQSKVSLDIGNFFNDQISNLTKEELIKIYLYDYYSMMKRLKSDYFIVNRFKEENKILRPYLYENNSMDATFSDSTVVNFFNVGGTIISSSFSGPEFDTVLASEVNVNPIYSKLDNLQNALLRVKPDNFYFNRLFKETKGFISSIRFIYDCLNKYLVPDDERLSLEIKEVGEPFKLAIKGSVDREIYRSGVEYLTHPLGFVYTYDQIRQIKFDDYFSVVYKYKNSKVEVRCLYGNSEEYNKTIKEVVKFNGTLKVIFDDLTLLVQENGEIRYLNYEGKILKKYHEANHCSIYLKYDLIYAPTIYDSVHFIMKSNAGFDKVEVSDEIKYTITYTPKLGLIIGRFYLGTGEKFLIDSNIYRFGVTDEFDTQYYKNIKHQDNIAITEKLSSIEKSKIEDDKVNVKDSKEKVFQTLHTKDNINIEDTSKMLVVETFKEEIYGKDIGETITFTIPLTAEDNEGENLNEILNIHGFNGIQEQIQYNDNLREVVTTTISDFLTFSDHFVYQSLQIIEELYELIEKQNFNLIFKNEDTTDFNISESQRINQSAKIFDNFGMIYDEFVVQPFSKTSDTITINDDMKITLTSKFKTDSLIGVGLIDTITINDDMKITLTSKFKTGSLIGDGLIDGTGTIIDTDIVEYYKYNDNMSIL